MNSYYLHNFVTDKTANKAGTTLIKLVEELALSNNKKRLRLDCAIDNTKLNNYYEQQGFILAGYCEDGPYKSNKREKILVR
ncbi:GNAT family N-acetyltransferase [uncultured Clostridium sp.]|uniref:GNAT family N-acetyltransferase n=1 Tax=uncultured Clostridium sp. TaxID=59620 RepID=UPI00344DEBF4